MNRCEVDRCHRRVHARGRCHNHYKLDWTDRRTPPIAGTFRTTHADIDETVVLRLVAGDLPDFYTGYERREAVRRLRNEQLSYTEIAARLRTNPRKIHRDITALGLIGASA